MTTPTTATVTLQMTLEVADPEAFLAWAAAADNATRGQTLARREATQALVSDVPSALRWVHQADPDIDPPDVTVTGRSLGVEATEPLVSVPAGEPAQGLRPASGNPPRRGPLA